MWDASMWGFFFSEFFGGLGGTLLWILLISVSVIMLYKALKRHKNEKKKIKEMEELRH